ncbi:MAG TPA: cupin domain-containing protein [Candidatus Hydrogenedentes bacterium]|nr:cupin domain-containing protein [Candidatus Hydrogenedentota bacterium]HOS03742.1 cupin domain-containing protein [Candidatus Hydrogenedentota bacterium]
METKHVFFRDIAAELEVPENGTLSRTLFSDDRLKVVVFGMDKGQELSEHTASMPAVLHILRGEAALRIGGDALDAGPGAWAHMPANMPHSVTALSPLVMALLLMKNA